MLLHFLCPFSFCASTLTSFSILRKINSLTCQNCFCVCVFSNFSINLYPCVIIIYLISDCLVLFLDALGTMLATHLDKHRAYIGCMKSGEVFSDKNQMWFEPEWWKFGDGKLYFQHASGEMFVVSRALAQFVSINRFVFLFQVMS
ncbi:hypothetical protein ZIOFF_036527 [Zingiber officinale]|uniref:Hexosyltransferase n=1 Tax=Zingiber officinale TaxID=94328 RepID=A0A8J5GDV0_ZINOF|nr:hypothetical protein ZIOFF_036527 [Zingiber officinale]